MAERSYKDKYLDALDDQERAERQFAVQLETIKKTLSHLAAAAQGLDKTLDANLITLKDVMRGGGGAQVIAQMELVQKAVREFEANREREQSAAAHKYKQIIEHLLTLQIPKDLQEKLKYFDKTLSARLQNYRNYPSALSEFTTILDQALQSASQPEKSLWGRIRGGKTVKTASPSEPVTPGASASTGGEKLSKASSENPSHKETDSEEAIPKDGKLAANTNQATPGKPESFSKAELQLSSDNEEAFQKEKGEKTAEAFSAGGAFLPDEDEYGRVTQRIRHTLLSLLDNIEPNEITRNKMDIVHSRLERGMDWYGFAVTLEDLRDILMRRYLDVDKEFGDYLKRVNEELLAISEALGLAVASESHISNAAEKFSDTVTQQVLEMQSSLSQTASIDGLKQAVTGHLATIQDALRNFQQEKQSVSSQALDAAKVTSADEEGRAAQSTIIDGSLSEQLKKLVARVQAVESEAEETKVQLQEQRYRATHDPLTTLPNREAYGERAHQEMQRFQRYGRPLTLAICDIDFFKKINDGYGHAVGDKVLKLIAKIISTRLREVDFVARFGGEEFVVLMPETTSSQAQGVLDKIRKAIAATPFRVKDAPLNITLSFGIGEMLKDESLESLFERADAALYQAKGDGRNRCVISSDPKAD